MGRRAHTCREWLHTPHALRMLCHAAKRRLRCVRASRCKVAAALAAATNSYSRAAAPGSRCTRVDPHIVHLHDLRSSEVAGTARGPLIEANPAPRATDSNVEDQVEALVKGPLGTVAGAGREGVVVVAVDVPVHVGAFPVDGVGVPLRLVGWVRLSLLRVLHVIVGSSVDSAIDA